MWRIVPGSTVVRCRQTETLCFHKVEQMTADATAALRNIKLFIARKQISDGGWKASTVSAAGRDQAWK